MSNIQNPQSFRNQPVSIGVGPFDEHGKQKQIEISDLPYGKHKEFMQIINSIFLRIQTIPKTIELFDIIAKKLVESGKTAFEAVQAIDDQIKNIYAATTDDEKLTLMKLLTLDQVDSELMDKMQVTEVHSLLSWLIERNLIAEKNFEASLSSILIPKEVENVQK